MNPKTSQNQRMNFHIPNRSGRWQSVAEIFPGRDLRGWARGAEAKPLRCAHSHSKSGRKQNTRDWECWCWNVLKIFVSIWLYGLYMIILYIYVQYTYLPWLAEVFSWTKSKDKRDLASWFEFDLPPVAQGGLHVHAGEEHGGWQWNWWRDPFAKRQLLNCWKPKMAWVCDGSNRDLSAQSWWFWGQDRNPEQGGDMRIALLGICMQLNIVSIHMKIWDCPYHSIWGHWLLQVPQGLLAACDAPRYVNILF